MPMMHQQPDSPKASMILGRGKHNITCDNETLGRHGIQHPIEVIQFLKSPAGETLRERISTELETERFINETLMSEQARQAALAHAIVAQHMALIKEERYEERYQQEAIEALNQMLLEEDVEEKPAPEQEKRRGDEYRPDVDFEALEKEIRDYYIAHELLHEETNTVDEFIGYLAEKERELEEKLEKTFERIQDLDAAQQDEELLNVYRKFYEEELNSLNVQITQTEEAKSSAPAEKTPKLPTPSPAMAKRVQELKTNYSQKMLHAINQTAAPGDQPTAAAGAQAKMNINPAEATRGNIANVHTTVRNQYDAMRQGLSNQKTRLEAGHQTRLKAAGLGATTAAYNQKTQQMKQQARAQAAPASSGYQSPSPLRTKPTPGGKSNG